MIEDASVFVLELKKQLADADGRVKQLQLQLTEESAKAKVSETFDAVFNELPSLSKRRRVQCANKDHSPIPILRRVSRESTKIDTSNAKRISGKIASEAKLDNLLLLIILLGVINSI